MKTSAWLALWLVACGSDPSTPPDASGSVELSAASSATIRRTQEVRVPVTITRTGMVGAVDLGATDLPAGVTVMPTTIAAEATTGELVLAATSDAALGTTATITLTATGGGAAPLDVLIADPAGTPDETFAPGGVVFFDRSAGDDYGQGCAMAADGDILVRAMVADFMDVEVLRVTPAGALDGEFGTGGAASVGNGAGVLVDSQALVERGDGSILVANSVNAEVRITGFDAGGDRLAGFGNGSQQVVIVPGAGLGFELLVDPAGDAYALTFGGSPTTTRLAKLTGSGPFDPGFGTAGVVTMPMTRHAHGLVEADGTFLLGGGQSTVTLTRLDAAGDPVNSFGGDGIADLAAVSDPFIYGIAAASDGGAYIATEGRVYRGTSAGELDLGFAGDGGLELVPRNMALLTAGDDLVAVVSSQALGSERFDVYRIDPSGALVDEFGSDGIAGVFLGGRTGFPTNACKDGLGRAVVVGGTDDASDADVFVARVWL